MTQQLFLPQYSRHFCVLSSLLIAVPIALVATAISEFVLTEPNSIYSHVAYAQNVSRETVKPAYSQVNPARVFAETKDSSRIITDSPRTIDTDSPPNPSLPACFEYNCRQYAFQGKMGQSVTILLENFDSVPSVVLRDARGNSLLALCPVNGTASFNVKLPIDGIYKLSISVTKPEDKGTFRVLVRDAQSMLQSPVSP